MPASIVWRIIIQVTLKKIGEQIGKILNLWAVLMAIA